MGSLSAASCVYFIAFRVHIHMPICSSARRHSRNRLRPAKWQVKKKLPPKSGSSHIRCVGRIFTCIFIHQALRAKGDVTVDVRAGLANIRLVHLHHAQMPDSKATDEIATWARNLHRKGVQAPFPFQVKLVRPKHVQIAFSVYYGRISQDSCHTGVVIRAMPALRPRLKKREMRL